MQSDWVCARCTFSSNPETVNVCIMCDGRRDGVSFKPLLPEKPKTEPVKNVVVDSGSRSSSSSSSNSNMKRKGRIIYQTDRITETQLGEIFEEYTINSSVSTGKYPVVVFGDNDVDLMRPIGTEREYNGGLAGVCGMFDRTICYGVVTTWYTLIDYHQYDNNNNNNNNKGNKINRPDWNDFKAQMNEHFKEIRIKYIDNGHDVIIPSPNNEDLTHSQWGKNYFDTNGGKKKQQIIFHNLGAGIAQLPLTHLQYIQFKIDQLHNYSLGRLSSADIENNNQNQLINEQNQEKEKEKEEEKKKENNNINKVEVYQSQDRVQIFDETHKQWLDGIVHGLEDNDIYFVEINKYNNKDEPYFMKVNAKNLRKPEASKKNNNNNNNNNKEEEKEEKSLPLISIHEKDQWDEFNDFVFTEYIRSILDIIDNPFNNIEGFIKEIGKLGIETERSRNRAFRLLDDLKKEELSKAYIDAIQQKEEEDKRRRLQNERNDPLVSEELARMLQDGHFLKEFICKGCLKKQTAGGIELRNCQDPICYDCFKNTVDTCLVAKQAPQCPTCQSMIHIGDIEVHISKNKSHEISEMLTQQKIAEFGDVYNCYDTTCGGYLAIEQRTIDNFRCPKCNQNNCILCKKIHPPQLCPLKPQPKVPIVRPMPVLPVLPGPIPSRPSEQGGRPTLAVVLNRKEWISNEYFFNQWEEISGEIAEPGGEGGDYEEVIEMETLSRMCKSFLVPKDSDEWKNVLRYVEDETTVKREWVQVERIQQGKLWLAYQRYCQSLKEKGVEPEERAFWHGTRATEPVKIWKGTGFDITFARIGGCLWFAVSNTYSMSGFHYACTDGSNCYQIFLALVATGVGDHCRFIRSDTILNVYKNECTYPAYVITYRLPNQSIPILGWSSWVRPMYSGRVNPPVHRHVKPKRRRIRGP